MCRSRDFKGLDKGVLYLNPCNLVFPGKIETFEQIKTFLRSNQPDMGFDFPRSKISTESGEFMPFRHRLKATL